MVLEGGENCVGLKSVTTKVPWKKKGKGQTATLIHTLTQRVHKRTSLPLFAAPDSRKIARFVASVTLLCYLARYAVTIIFDPGLDTTLARRPREVQDCITI
jgi:hypothetical protein